MSNYCFVHDCHFPEKPCPMCAKFYTDRSPSPAQPLAADTSPTGWDAGYETLKVLPGDVLTTREYLARCKEIPAQPASTLDTSPPSRTSNAAPADGAASFLLDIVASNIEDLIHRVNKGREADLTKGDLGWLVAARQAIGRLKRIEVSGVVSGHAIEEAHLSKNTTGMAAHVAPALGNEQGGIGTESENSRAGVTTCLTSSVAQFHTCAHTRLKGYTCESCHREQEELAAKIYDGMQRLKEEAEALVLEPMSEPAIRAAVYDCTDAQCVCGRCGPVRMAIDPWQGLGKTWGDK